MCHKKKLKLENYKNWLGATQLENKINHIERKQNYIEPKIVLSSNEDKKVQSIDSIERYTHGTSNNLVSEGEEVKRNNIINIMK